MMGGAKVADDIAHDGQRMFVIVGKMVGHARLAAVQVAAAQILGRDHLPVAACTSGGPARKIVPCSFTMMDSSLIAGT